MVGVIDYNAGNLKSVELALEHLNVQYVTSENPDVLLKCDKLIFPGVGEAAYAMENLKERKLIPCINNFVKSGKDLFGICLGTQIIFSHSEESDTTCLGLIEGKVRKFPSDMGLKIPQIGWNTLRFPKDDPIFKDVNPNSSFYFVHSYYVDPDSTSSSIAISDYGIDFTAAVRYKNIVATQFHPEKSGEQGLKILSNFCNG